MVKITHCGTFSKDMEQMYSLELCGPLLPTSIAQLCEIFSETQETFSCYFVDIDPRSRLLNVGISNESLIAQTQKTSTQASNTPGFYYWINASVSNGEFEHLKYEEMSEMKGIVIKSITLSDSLQYSVRVIKGSST